jgi:nucleoside-diphosphate-sugar epimerase
MKVLVTGGTGVVGEGAIAALLARGHGVRLLCRNPELESSRWPGVETRQADVASAAQMEGTATGCDAILHVAGIVGETLPDATFDAVNVEGTRHVVHEAERGGIRRLVFVSSLGADRGASAYHRSKLQAETIVASSGLDWTIVRSGVVYGPGDPALSKLLVMVRTLPAIPVIADGTQRFQPVWYEDLGEALCNALEDGTLGKQTLEVAGPEQTTPNDVLDLLGDLTGRAPVRVRVPAGLAAAGLKVAAALGVAPVAEAQLTMLEEENIIRPGRENALTGVLRVRATSLHAGLRKLADVLPEKMPTEGVGPMEHKRFWADIHGWRTAAQLKEQFRRRFAEVMPLEVGAVQKPVPMLKKGTTFSLKLPARGILAMRVAEVSKDCITALTLQGHALAGSVTFHFTPIGGGARFEVEMHARAADALDRALLQTLGGALQNGTWRNVVHRMVEISEGEAPKGVESESRTLDDDEAREVERHLDQLVMRRKKETVARPKGRTRSKAAGTGNARRSPAGSGSARTSGRSGPRSPARTGS